MMKKMMKSLNNLVEESKKLYEEALNTMQETNLKHMEYEENLVNIL